MPKNLKNFSAAATGRVKEFSFFTQDADTLAMLEEAELYAQKDIAVLITGESGTGKEILAGRIHKLSPRKNKPLVDLNCAAIPFELFEAQVFGIEKGVCTGVARNRGYLEMANQSTLFLDEIGDMPLNAQVKLLRALEGQSITRVGGTIPRPSNFRVIAATNLNFARAIKEKKFREDLYHRLNIGRLHIKPLRERRGDIPLLAEHFLSAFKTKYGYTDTRISDGAYESIRNHPWFGNARELRNAIERAVIIAKNGPIHTKDLALPVACETDQRSQLITALVKHALQMEQSGLLPTFEKKLIAETFDSCYGDEKATARVLGIDVKTLYAKAKEYGLDDLISEPERLTAEVSDQDAVLTQQL